MHLAIVAAVVVIVIVIAAVFYTRHTGYVKKSPGMITSQKWDTPLAGSKHPNYSIFNDTLDNCKAICSADEKCIGVSWPNKSDPSKAGQCWLEHTFDVAGNFPNWDLYVKH